MGTRDEAIGIVKSTFVSVNVRIIKYAAAYYIPILASPFPQKLIDIIARKILTWIAQQGENQAFFGYIDWRTGDQSKAFEEAAYANHMAQVTGDKDAIQKAETDLWAAFIPFARLSG